MKEPYIGAPDSEAVAAMISNLSYDETRQEEVLAKYQALCDAQRTQ